MKSNREALVSALQSLLNKSQFDRMIDLINRMNDGPVAWAKIIPISADHIVTIENLPKIIPDDITKILHKVAILKLNGGLGTSMGLTGAKSSIIVKNNKSFLELIIEQIRILNKKYHTSVPLVLMNSQNTDEETKRAIKDIKDVEILCFNQEYYPRLDSETLMPLCQTVDSPSRFWYPPGHGNLYDSLNSSGMLDLLLKRGIEILFISNVDNLGATFDFQLAGSFLHSPSDVLIEVTNKTERDIKGGAIVQYQTDSGKIYKDLEIAEVPPEYLHDFHLFPHFNTGNLWIKLPFLRTTLSHDKLKLDVIKNYKMIDGRRIVQLETASGSIISTAHSVDVVNVPRSRFIPTKTCADLAVIMSDCYVWDTEKGTLDLNPTLSRTPSLSLPSEYSSLHGLQEHFNDIPSMFQLHSLTITGDVRLSSGVTLKGDVQILADTGKTLVIPPNALLENVRIEGTLTPTSI